MTTIARELDAYLHEWGAAAFDWRAANCTTFAGAWVRRMTGRNALAGVRACKSALDARRMVEAGGGMPALVSVALGLQPMAPTLAQIGDVVMLDGDVTGATLGLCAGRTAAALAQGGGIAHLAMTEAVHAWRLTEVAP